jgi:hypothetical protein
MLIFPTFVPGQMNFRFPLKWTPKGNTIQQDPASGRGENRISTTYYPRFIFTMDISYIIGDAQGSDTMWQQLTNFYIANQFAASDWLFLHPWDHSVTNQAIATGDGSTASFDMIRTFVSGGAPDLIQNFVSPPSIYVNGVLQTVTTDYTINSYGTITFTSGHIPASGHVISWTGDFYYRCHFLEDSWSSYEEDLYQIWSNHELKFRSVLI